MTFKSSFPESGVLLGYFMRAYVLLQAHEVNVKLKLRDL